MWRFYSSQNTANEHQKFPWCSGSSSNLGNAALVVTFSTPAAKKYHLHSVVEINPNSEEDFSSFLFLYEELFETLITTAASIIMTDA